MSTPTRGSPRRRLGGFVNHPIRPCRARVVHAIRTGAGIRRLRVQDYLTRAAETQIETCQADEPTKLGEDVPDNPSDARSVRAEVPRRLSAASSPTGSQPLPHGTRRAAAHRRAPALLCAGRFSVRGLLAGWGALGLRDRPVEPDNDEGPASGLRSDAQGQRAMRPVLDRSQPLVPSNTAGQSG